MQVEFAIIAVPCYERFLSKNSGFPLSQKTNIPSSNSITKRLKLVGKLSRAPWVFYFSVKQLSVTGSLMNVVSKSRCLLFLSLARNGYVRD